MCPWRYRCLFETGLQDSLGFYSLCLDGQWLTAYTDFDLKEAFKQKESIILIKDEKIGNSFLLAGKIQEGHLPIIILKRLDGDRICNVSVGEGIVISVTKDMVPDLMRLWEVLEEGNIEIDIEEVVGRKINLYYGN